MSLGSTTTQTQTTPIPASSEHDDDGQVPVVPLPDHDVAADTVSRRTPGDTGATPLPPQQPSVVFPRKRRLSKKEKNDAKKRRRRSNRTTKVVVNSSSLLVVDTHLCSKKQQPPPPPPAASSPAPPRINETTHGHAVDDAALVGHSNTTLQTQVDVAQETIDEQDGENVTTTTAPIVVEGDSCTNSSERKDAAMRDEHHSSSAAEEMETGGDDNNTMKAKDISASDNESPSTVDYLASYEPIALHTSKETADEQQGLGKWFPNAKIVKRAPPITLHKRKAGSNDNNSNNNNDAVTTASSSTTVRCSLLLFYQYATPKWKKDRVESLIAHLSTIGRVRGLGGRIRVAPEGVNATVSCVGRAAVRHLAEDLRRFDPAVFHRHDDGTDNFKYVDDLPLDRHFKNLKILPVQELVFYGIRDERACALEQGGVHLAPQAYHEKLAEDNTVVIDVRNHYEAAIGRFDGQRTTTNNNNATAKNGGKGGGGGGAEYLDPLMRKSTDFPRWLAKQETQDKIAGKQVLMYCTGGVRCERASAYLKSQLGDKVQEVYQLRGGIEQYLQEFPDGGYWKGKNYVFDKREAISVNNPEGDGGVVRKKKKSTSDGTVGTTCCCCAAPWDRYIGKKKCYTCGVPVLMCDGCMSKKPDKSAAPEVRLSVRCPLCVQEGITVPAADVEYTENGIKSKATTTTTTTAGGHEKKKSNTVSLQRGTCTTATEKAASSVLKWGGGHATKKRESRKMKRKQCQFGLECVRKDCFFAHPERDRKRKN